LIQRFTIVGQTHEELETREYIHAEAAALLHEAAPRYRESGHFYYPLLDRTGQTDTVNGDRRPWGPAISPRLRTRWTLL